MSSEMVPMANGKSVPKRCVDALDKLEETWPGATFKMARAAIVRVVLEADAPSREGVRCNKIIELGVACVGAEGHGGSCIPRYDIRRFE